MQLVGSLNYLAYLHQTQHCIPSLTPLQICGVRKGQEKHLEAAERCGRSLKGTPTHGVTLGSTDH